MVHPSIHHEVMGPDAMIFIFLMLSFKPAFLTLLFHLHQKTQVRHFEGICDSSLLTNASALPLFYIQKAIAAATCPHPTPSSSGTCVPAVAPTWALGLHHHIRFICFLSSVQTAPLKIWTRASHFSAPNPSLRKPSNDVPSFKSLSAYVVF